MTYQRVRTIAAIRSRWFAALLSALAISVRYASDHRQWTNGRQHMKPSGWRSIR